MALTYTRQLLNGGSNGKPISVDATASPGTIIHTVEPTATNAREELYLYAHLMATSDKRLTIEWGGQASQDAIVQDLTEGDGMHVVVPGLNLTATTSIVRAYATAGGGEIAISGWVNRAT
jgi:hypothetical protein